MRMPLLMCLTLMLLPFSSASATVKLLVSTFDGFAIAADSRVTLSDKEKHRIASDSYNKVFRTGKCVGVACSGTAFLLDENQQRRNIGSIVEAYRTRNGITDTTEVSPHEVAQGLGAVVEEVYNSQKLNLLKGPLHLWVFGYDAKKDRRIFEVYTNRDSLEVLVLVSEKYNPGVVASLVGGQTDVYSRLIKGYDPGIRKISCFESEKDKIDDLRYEIRYDLMSLQDAIDFAVFIVRATIEAQRFNQDAVMGVGGNIDVAVITPDGFRWVQKKQLHGESE